MVGYTRAEVMHRSCSCSFMFGEQTDKETIRKIESCLQQYESEQLEIRLYKKNSKFYSTTTCERVTTVQYCNVISFITEVPVWLLMHLAPIKNDKEQVVLFLCQFRDITALKQPLDDDSNKGIIYDVSKT